MKTVKSLCLKIILVIELLEHQNLTFIAPVTRLRRRLSVEATEEKSSTPNTPTKKRGNPHKPQLDLIDENGIKYSCH